MFSRITWIKIFVQINVLYLVRITLEETTRVFISKRSFMIPLKNVPELPDTTEHSRTDLSRDLAALHEICVAHSDELRTLSNERGVQQVGFTWQCSCFINGTCKNGKWVTVSSKKAWYSFSYSHTKCVSKTTCEAQENYIRNVKNNYRGYIIIVIQVGMVHNSYLKNQSTLSFCCPVEL